MTQALDTAGNTITEAYDNLNRVTSETTPQGQISYGYDLAGRRASMTVAGQPQVTYSYDSANRLMQIAQGTSTVGFSYDTASRRSTLTLSNGVNMSYTYDNESRVTGITYKFNANTLGNLTYSYDSLGRRTQVGGSFAQTGLPGAISSATYDAANELTNWNGSPISYDLNGNMLSDGANTFTWNARNQVATLNSVSLQYDGFGRRTKNPQNTSFLFDGANAVQELSGSTPTANLISGGIDEIFSRADFTGNFTPLKDALGSTIALVDASGNLVTQYSYDPFGNTTVSGAANSNAFQYTGRENEGNGLYFYRARYYSPLLGRFVNEDPLGFDGGDVDLYAYAGNDPTDNVDPLGESSLCPSFIQTCNPAPQSGSATSSRGNMSFPRWSNLPHRTHPPGHNRSADFFNLQISGGLACGGTISWSLDKNGNLYLGVGPECGKSLTPISASLTGNWLDQYSDPTPADLDNYLSKSNISGTAGGIIVGQQGFWPGSGGATGIGMGTPQAGVGYTYSWKLGQTPIQWPYHH
jgi:RHS repeat-associated protein